jgi:penicillin G amidase
MRRVMVFGFCLAFVVGELVRAAPTPASTLTIVGLEQPVEVLRDRWGLNHIYAKTEHDLFFAQGYSAARDRLFQF